MEERVIIVDRNNHEVDQVNRSDMRRQNLIHRASYVIVYDGEDRLFIQRRAANKDLYPDLYEPGCGGVVLAGESYEEAASRELAEELAVHGVAMDVAFDFYQETADNRVWGRVFRCQWSGPVRLQGEEVAWGDFLTLAAIRDLLARRCLTPDGELILARLHPELIQQEIKGDE